MYSVLSITNGHMAWTILHGTWYGTSTVQQKSMGCILGVVSVFYSALELKIFSFLPCGMGSDWMSRVSCSPTLVSL